MNQKIQEQIKLKTELLKALFVLLLADITAVLSLTKNQTGKPIDLVYIMLGFFSIFGLLIIAVIVYFRILSLIKKS